jgi:hypothetical protein
MKNGYEQTYDVIVPRLMECDFSDAVQRLGFTLATEDHCLSPFSAEPTK